MMPSQSAPYGAASSPKGRAKGCCRICPPNYNFSRYIEPFMSLMKSILNCPGINARRLLGYYFVHERKNTCISGRNRYNVPVVDCITGRKEGPRRNASSVGVSPPAFAGRTCENSTRVVKVDRSHLVFQRKTNYYIDSENHRNIG